MRFFVLIVCILLGYASEAQNLAELELKLSAKLQQLRNSKTNNEINQINEQFTKEMGEFVRKDGAFEFNFTQLPTIADLKSDDGLVRIIHWNLEYIDFTYSYSGFILRRDPDKETTSVYNLVDATDPYSMIPEQVVDSKNWYGALYYRIIPVDYNNEMQYVLLGWDGATTSSNFKIIDVLVFKGNSAKFGSPLFVAKNKVQKRVVFEYADKSIMSLKMDEKRNRIVFDHLSPESPALTGIYSYYVPDFSYDSYVWEEDRFILNEDVIAVNDDAEKESIIYVMDPKTGKVKKETYKLKWINPEDKQHQGDISHVARTPESENQSTETNPLIENAIPKKKWWDRRNPNNLSVTTGKYRKNRRRHPEP